MYFTETDHLGSIIGLLRTDGTVQEQYSYDPWGRRRNPVDWSYNNVPTTFLIDRGFTGHEHLDKFGLINMNGRIYDPVLGRFLSVDPVIQSPYFSQSYNSYTYCFNNPLKYIDPSGYSAFINIWQKIKEFLSGGNENREKKYSIIPNDQPEDLVINSYNSPYCPGEVEVIGGGGAGRRKAVNNWGNQTLIINSDVYYILAGTGWEYGVAQGLASLFPSRIPPRSAFNNSAASKAAKKVIGKVGVGINWAATIAEGHDLYINRANAGTGDVAKFGVDAGITFVTSILYISGVGTPFAILLTGVQIANTLGIFDSIYESFNRPINSYPRTNLNEPGGSW
jgi:RHS repeat-associated protein